MVVKDVGQVIPADDRFRWYRASALLCGIDDRIFGIEYHWHGQLSALERGDAVQAEGHLRMSVAEAVGLAAQAARTREGAARKASLLVLVGDRLDASVGGDAHRDHRGAIPMLAAAVEAEVRRWELPKSQPQKGGEDWSGSFDREPSLALRRSLEFNAASRPLAEAMINAEVMLADAATLATEEDWPAVRGADYHIRAALLHSLAIPAESPEEFELKLLVIDEWEVYLQPADLTRPMMETFLKAEGERFGRAVDWSTLWPSTSPDAGCEGSN